MVTRRSETSQANSGEPGKRAVKRKVPLWFLIDRFCFPPENDPMKPADTDSVPLDVQADMQAVIEHLTTGKPLDPETYRRIRERGERITEELRQRYGELDIAVDLIREVRDEE